VTTPAEPHARFNRHWAHDLSTGCHLWTGWRDEDGYGRFWQGQTWRAHRWLFRYVHGYLPPQVMHDCDTPACVNERHLLPGTRSDNMRDMVLKGRGRNQFMRAGTETEETR
jgi:hypothetical protein